MTRTGPPRLRARERVALALRRWWRGDLGAAGRALDLASAPAEWAYRLLSGAHRRAYSHGLLAARMAPMPVLSVGNIEVGGTGKTPVTAWLARYVEAIGERPAILHGGYAEDEPALHRRWNPDIPVIVGRDRYRSVLRAAELGASVAILDDAFQHRRLARDLDIVLVSLESYSARIRLFPRGGWRETTEALRRADVLAVTRRTGTAEEAERLLDLLAMQAPAVVRASFWLQPLRWRCWCHPERPMPQTTRAVAVAGIAFPEAFLEEVHRQGHAVRERLVFPDHHRYTSADLAAIRRIAGGDPILTTAKDAVKWPAGAAGENVWVLEQRVVPEHGESALAQAIVEALK